MSPELVTALRAETPSAPQGLRERVAAVATAAPSGRRRFTVRRVFAFAAPVAAGLSLAAAVAVGLNTAISPGPAGETAAKVAPPPAQDLGAREGVAPAFGPIDEASPGTARSAAPAPNAGRAQDYRATLTLLVDGTGELSTTTQEALRTARRLGGYVVAVSYSTPEPGEGTAAVRLRIPVSRVQAAIIEFSGLGRILAQDTQISDLQQGLDELTRQIRRLERRAATLRGEERARVLAQIAALRSQRAQINRQAAFATVNLDLTTHEPKEPGTAPGRFDRAVDDAVGILLAELAIVAYALIVASPLLILLAAGLLGNRAYRRHADQRLLERA